MNFKTNLISLALLLESVLCSSSMAYSQNQSMSGSTYYGGSSYSYKISDEDLVDTPSWDPAEGEPPLPLRKALEIARINLQRFVTKADYLGVEHIELRQMGVKKWLYEVAFHCWVRECEDKAGSSFRIFVKLDGSVVDPEVSPDPEEQAVTR